MMSGMAVKRCYACKKRIWFWQHRVDIYDYKGDPAWCHRRCFAKPARNGGSRRVASL